MRSLFAHDASDGRGGAYATLPHRTKETLKEFERLNTREARAAFADHWIGVWGQDFEAAWPAVYELLRIVEEDELYKDPRRVGPGAPGTLHVEKSSYGSFAEYFQDRLRQPLARWAELENTYHYAQTYAPELLKTVFSEARCTASAAKELGQDAANGRLPELGKAERDPTTGRFTQPDKKSDQDGYGTAASYRVARLQRDHPEIVKRLAAGEFRSVAEAVRYAEGETRGLTKLRRAWEQATDEERSTFLGWVTPRRDAAA